MQERRCLLVASTGGHLEQLARLEKRLAIDVAQVEFATFDDQHSRSLLEGRPVHHVERIPPRGLREVLRVAPEAGRIVRRGGFTDVISTGSAISVPFLAAARLNGVRGHYIESAARSDGPSMSGRIAARLPGVDLYTQYPGWADVHWHHNGSVFDPFRAVGALTPSRSPGRVVVTLGTMRNYPFRRAVDSIARVLAEIARPDVEVLWQVGDTPVSDLGLKGHNMIPAAEMSAAIRESDLVFAHAGIGSCLQILDSGRVPVLLPRSRRNGEHVDDHQRLIANELENRDLAVSRDPDSLTASDVAAALTRCVETSSIPQPFALAS